ncbi:TPA: hypothetical protein I6199_003595 [Vibrio cholerae]|nr:hypothetical protein [Vibrio cholerae]
MKCIEWNKFILFGVIISFNTNAYECPKNSKPEGDYCYCDKGYSLSKNKKECITKPIYNIDEVVQYAAKMHVCSENGYIHNSAVDDVRDKLRTYADHYIDDDKIEQIEIRTTVKIKTTFAPLGYGCEEAYEALMLLP